MRKNKKVTGKTGENVVDYRHRTSKLLNIPPAGWRSMFERVSYI
jgi:hypothetical protein